MIDRFIERQEQCYGCCACNQICPVGCVEMLPDKRGFWYPRVADDKCQQCRLCIISCPAVARQSRSGFLETPLAYAAKHVDDQVRYNSTSGGAFTALSDCILADKGIVFGAVFSEKLKVIHTGAQTVEQRNGMRGSKYVQSYIGNTYIEAEKFLKKGRTVLFTGTPCQIAGLQQYLGREYSNLYTVDFICHGTPSPAILRCYLNLMQARFNSRIKSVNFRHKANGGNQLTILIEFESGTYSNLLTCDPYGRLFLDNVILRPCCYECRYANASRISDITIADYWGSEILYPDFNDNGGVSLLIVNTAKGISLQEAVGGKLYILESSLEACTMYNAALNQPSDRPTSNGFWDDYTSGIEFGLLLCKYSSELVAGNRNLIDLGLACYIFPLFNEEERQWSGFLQKWQEWCDITFNQEQREERQNNNSQYKARTKAACSYGAFSVLSRYANRY